MERSYIPIRRFYEKCLPAAQANGYRYVICLLARDTGVDDLYQTLKAQWVALDDVTGKDFLFLFAGKHIEDDGHSGITYQGTEWDPHQGETIAYTEFVHTLNQNPRLHWGSYYDFRRRDERAKYTPDLPSEQTKHILELQHYFGLSRRDIPCLMFTNLDTGKHTRVAFDNSNLYGLMNEVLCELEKAFSVIDELKANIKQYSKIRQTKTFNDYEKRNNLYAGLCRVAEMLLPEYRAVLLNCMENLTFGDKFVDEVFLKRLNAFVGLSKSLTAVDTKIIEYIIKHDEPAHSQKNLWRVYERTDNIIAQLNKL
ncbi:MAG: hypothetical protein FWF10_02785 [Clostridiales bacterium]|nr:hypothetical protein [Clostridiales bacterium]